MHTTRSAIKEMESAGVRDRLWYKIQSSKTQYANKQTPQGGINDEQH